MILQAAQEFYRKHEHWVAIAFFVLGFVFDAFMLRRIDELSTLVQQAAYVLISAFLIRIELIDVIEPFTPPSFLKKLWPYREAFLHFLLGTLINSYTIFYFKSASAFTSFFFIALLVGLLMLNEFKRFGQSQTQVHMAFLSLCLVSYCVSLAPIVLGFIGLLPFLLATASSTLLFGVYYFWTRPRLLPRPSLAKTHLLMPFAGVQILFVVLYFAHAIPPVPLSVSYMGVFHEVQKREGVYQLSYTRPAWKFWQHGDQSFAARPGDSIYCFARVFSPTRFKDQLQVRWLYRDRLRGWQSSDAMDFPIVGGREQGYRGVTKKTHYTAGEWRVQIETMDHREVGRIQFTVSEDAETTDRPTTTLLQ